MSAAGRDRLPSHYALHVPADRCWRSWQLWSSKPGTEHQPDLYRPSGESTSTIYYIYTLTFKNCSQNHIFGTKRFQVYSNRCVTCATPLLYPFFSGTSQTISSKGERKLQRSWRGRKPFWSNRPMKKGSLWIDPSILLHRLTVCGCVFMPNWESCVWILGQLSEKVQAKQCFQQSLPTEPCYSNPHGT